MFLNESYYCEGSESKAVKRINECVALLIDLQSVETQTNNVTDIISTK